MSTHFMAVAASVLGQQRAQQENFLRKQGWVRLVERADVWYNPGRAGGDAHDVFQFRFAILEAARQSVGAYKPRRLRVHHHAGASV